MLPWVDEIRTAFKALGGAARYSDLYRFIELTTERELTNHWRATVRRTIEDHSSDSMNFRSNDYFQKFGHGFWGLRGISVSDEELAQRKSITPEETVRRVFVQEHWRSYPSEGDQSADSRILDHLQFSAAWCSDNTVEIRFSNGLRIRTPLAWFPEIQSATSVQKASLIVSGTQIDWVELAIKISLIEALIGRQAD